MWNIDGRGGRQRLWRSPSLRGRRITLSPALKETSSWWTYGFLKAPWFPWSPVLSQGCGADVDFTHGLLQRQLRAQQGKQDTTQPPVWERRQPFSFPASLIWPLNPWFTCAWWDLPWLLSAARRGRVQTRAHQKYLGIFCWYLQRDFGTLTSFEGLNLLTRFLFTTSSGGWLWSAQLYCHTQPVPSDPATAENFTKQVTSVSSDIMVGAYSGWLGLSFILIHLSQNLPTCSLQSQLIYISIENLLPLWL